VKLMCRLSGGDEEPGSRSQVEEPGSSIYSQERRARRRARVEEPEREPRERSHEKGNE
jgi:hypothetical protein